MTGAVFLSAGVPDPTKPHFVGPSDATDVIGAVRALVYVVLGRRHLIWGGHPAITPVVWSVAESLHVNYGNWVTLYQSTYFEDQYPEDNLRFSNTRYVEAVERAPGMTEPERQAASLTRMRRSMFAENEFQSAVFIGGMKGVFEEFDLFGQLCPEARRIPLLSTGGAALMLRERLSDADQNIDFSRLENDVDYVPLLFELCGIEASERRSVA